MLTQRIYIQITLKRACQSGGLSNSTPRAINETRSVLVPAWDGASCVSHIKTCHIYIFTRELAFHGAHACGMRVYDKISLYFCNLCCASERSRWKIAFICVHHKASRPEDRPGVRPTPSSDIDERRIRRETQNLHTFTFRVHTRANPWSSQNMQSTQPVYLCMEDHVCVCIAGGRRQSEQVYLYMWFLITYFRLR